MTTPNTQRIGPAPHIAVDDAGDGELVIFLHGIGGNRKNWRGQVIALADHFHTVAWDARGYGDSDDYEGPLAFSDFSDDLLRVLDHFGAEKAHFVGLSMGGRIIMDFYQRHPQRVKTLSICDTSGGTSEARDDAKIEKFLEIRKAPLLAGKTPADIAPDVVKSLIGPSTTDEHREQLTQSLAELHAESYMKTLDCVTRYHDFPPFPSIQVPTLVIAGVEDPIAHTDLVKQMAAQIPDAQLVLIPNAAHVSNVEQPEMFNNALREFLLAHKG